MTDRATLLALAERVEKAEGPDRDLDAEIDLYLSLPEITRRGGVALVSDGGIHEWYGLGPPAPQRNPATGAWRAPRMEYTASIDAAVTLVPEGWGWQIRRSHTGHRAVCYLWSGSGVWSPTVVATAPALALTAAALRAKAEEMKE